MKKIFKITALLLFATSVYTQNYLSGKQKLSIGVEYGFTFKTLSESDTRGLKQLYGLNFGIPVNQFTFEFGLLRNDYGNGGFKNYNGDTEIRNGATVYYYDLNDKHLDYFQLSNRVQYRLPCNCVFFHVGFNLEYLRPNSDNEIYKDYITYRSPENFNKSLKIKQLNTGIELGVGFKQHISDNWKIIMRPTMHLMRPFSETKDNFDKNGYKTFRITLGVQRGI